MDRDRGIKNRARAMEQLLQAAGSPVVRSIAPAQSVGLVLAASVCGASAVPEVACSRRDGYALRSTDVPGQLYLEGLIPAEAVDPVPLAPGTAVRVLTGGPVPKGADCVVADEDVSEYNGMLMVRKPVPAGRHVLAAGGDFPLGGHIGHAGEVVTPQMAGVMVRSRVSGVEVHPRPRAAVCVIGSELADPYDPDASNASARMPADNAVLACGLLEAAGFEVVARAVVADGAARVEAFLHEAEAELFITTGGTGHSERDVARSGVTQAGFETIFHGVDIRPGKGMFAARRQGQVLLGLPGPPGAVFACLHGFVPALSAVMRGLAPPEPSLAELAEPVTPRKAGDWLVPCTLAPNGATVTAHLLKDGSMTAFEGLARAQAVAVVPGGPTLEAGSTVELLSLHV